MFKNNKIFILGFARSGYEAAKFLIKSATNCRKNCKFANK